MVFLVVFGLYLDPFLESGLAVKFATRYSGLTCRGKEKGRASSLFLEALPTKAHWVHL